MNLCTLGLSGCTCTSGFGETVKWLVLGLKDQKSPRDRDTLRNGMESQISFSPDFLGLLQTTLGTPFLLVITLPPEQSHKGIIKFTLEEGES